MLWMNSSINTILLSIMLVQLLAVRRGQAFSVRIFSPSLLARTRAGRFSSSALSESYSSSSNKNNDEYDVIVVGGGHAGCDAATAAARTGARTALVTQRLDTIGELSCNPSIGGIGKGHLVREIDALDGVMGWAADQAGIHYRVLNRSKGPAVRGPRAQMDRDLYKAAMQDIVRNYPNLHLVEASVEDLLLDESNAAGLESMAPMQAGTGLLGAEKDRDKLIEQATIAVQKHRKARIRGVTVSVADDANSGVKSTRELYARAVVLTTGTFLRGVLMLGHDRYAGGRHLRDSEQVEPPSTGLAETLARFDFPLSRLKTGTPARIDGKTIDWDACTIQPTENPVQAFSHLLQFRGKQPVCIAKNRVIDCYQTATNEETHKLVMEFEHTLPKYDGLDGKGNGPRYCPSIYKKVQRFPERNGHNCFLEPEGLNTDMVYPNGMSGPYPQEIQQKILRTMKGLGAVEIVRPGYDVEYDFVNPISLTHTLETKKIGGLYLAGQICGTTGYEEAAAQGIVAGANAGRAAVAAASGVDEPPTPFVIGRDEGYIGVLIDDLVTRGTLEPYRMFTSRAEYRISLRADNADLRLTRKGMAYGLVTDDERIAAVESRVFMIDDRIEKLRKFNLKVSEWAAYGDRYLMGGAELERKGSQRKTAVDIVNMPHVTLKDVEDIMLTVTEERRKNPPVEEMDGVVRTLEVEDFSPTPLLAYDTVEASVKYETYKQRQHKDMESWRRAQGLRIPPDIVYDLRNLPQLNLEEIEKLNKIRPKTFAEASRISGLTPQSLVFLYYTVIRQNKPERRMPGAPKLVEISKQ
jgi:tRNA uridine 5-carboxymethylaminomethyl modification enzyme